MAVMLLLLGGICAMPPLMGIPLSLPFAQADAAASAAALGPSAWEVAVKWLRVWGDASWTDTTYGPLFAHFMTWVKTLAWVSLVAWVFSWVVASLKRYGRKWEWSDFAIPLALVCGVGAIVIQEMINLNRVSNLKIQSVGLSNILLAVAAIVSVLWVELSLWRGMTHRQAGNTRADIATFFGIHLALAFGFFIASSILGFEQARREQNPVYDAELYGSVVTVPNIIVIGARLGTTFMGIVVLIRIASGFFTELFRIRFRRLYAIAWQTYMESVRVMKAPYVVIVVFFAILAFLHWFLQPPENQRAAELTQVYVGALLLLLTALLTVMVSIIIPMSLPKDIENQTIYTIVSKPVNRLELIWGRVMGVMGLVTILCLVLGLGGSAYLHRMISNELARTLKEADELRETKPLQAKQKEEEARQLESRWTSRSPLLGSLTFIDTQGVTDLPKGIDVGQEQEYRSHIEGATPAAAIWSYGAAIPDPIDVVRFNLARQANPGLTMNMFPIRYLDRRVPVASFLEPNTIEWFKDRKGNLFQGRQMALAEAQAIASTKPDRASELRNRAKQLENEEAAVDRELAELIRKYQELRASAKDANEQGREEEALRHLREAKRLRSPDFTMEMTFTIYRTTKGVVGEPVQASIEITNPRLPLDDPSRRIRLVVPIREYYTNSIKVPSEVLAGSQGDLEVKVQCISQTQYLGMAEPDLYILEREGSFTANFFKGLFGIWLQSLVLVSVGVMLGTCLNWRVALLSLIFVGVVGLFATKFVAGFFESNLLGGGPFESMVRLVTHSNQMTDLEGTAGVIVAKSFDAIATPMLSAVAFIIPNLNAFDFSVSISNGFTIPLMQLFSTFLLSLAYAIPFTVAGYIILKNREVAA